VPHYRDLRACIAVIVRYFARVIIVLFAIPLLSCGGMDYTPEEARAYFEQNKLTLLKLADLVSQCEGNGVTSIFPDGHTTAPDAVKCSSTTEIAGLLKTAKILWVLADSKRSYGKQGPFSAMFVLSSRGFVGHGSGSAIYYIPAEETNPFGDSVPLEGTPGHWFYRLL
jgi:hypothetical protein